MDTEPVVSVRGLVKHYGSFQAVQGIDFTVLRGHVFSLLGPNGAGKTTTVEILEGLRKATGGTLRVLGKDPWVHAGEVHRRVGVMPQGFRFFDKVTPREAIRYYGRLFHHDVDPDQVLARVLLTEKADDTFDKLSGGQKQKLGIALALVNDPEVLFLDEPTTGLDPQARQAVWALVRDLQQEGRTILLTTHYLEEAEELSDYTCIMHHGKVIAEGSPRSLIAKHGAPPRLLLKATPELIQFLRSRPELSGLRITDGVVRLPLDQKQALLQALQAVESSGMPWPDISTERDTLEHVFIQLVGKMAEGELA